MDTLACWRLADRILEVPGSLPNSRDTVTLNGVVAVQQQGNTDSWRYLFLDTSLEVLGAPAYLPSRFTQNGNLTTGWTMVSDGSTFVLAQGTFNSGTLNIGRISTSPKTIREQAAHAVFEQTGGEFNGSLVGIGASFVDLDLGVFYHQPGTLWLKGGRFNAPAIQPSPHSAVESIIKLDGGFLNATKVADMTEVIVGSTAPYRGALDRSNGQTLSCTRFSAGLDGGRASILVAGSGARLTASEVVLASGNNSQAGVAIGLQGEGVLSAGSLNMAVGSGSTATLQVEGALASVAVSGAMDVGRGGSALVTLRNGGTLTAGSLRVGAGSAGAPVARITLADTGASVRASTLTVGAGSGGELIVNADTRCEAGQLTVGQGGLLHLNRGLIDVEQANFQASSALRIDISSAVAGSGYSQMLGLSSLGFAGALELNFSGGFVPTAGQRFQLFGFDSFAGAFAPESITVTGIDRSALDFSRLAVDGTVWAGSAPRPLTLTITPALAPAASYDFTWASQPGKVYDLVTSTDLATPASQWPVYRSYRDLFAAGVTRTLLAVPGNEPRRFFAMAQRDAPVPQIPNPSFEEDTFTVWPGYLGPNGGAITGWAGAPSSGLNPAGGNPFADNGAVPHGHNVAFIQSSDDAAQMLSTTMTGLIPGVVYQVSFRANSRAGTAAPSTSWSLNARAFVPFTASPAVGGTNPYYTITGSFTATGSTAPLRIRNQTAADTSVLIDDFRIIAQ